MRGLVLTLALACATPASAETVTLSPVQMRQLGLELLGAGDLAAAAEVTSALLARDPQDPEALILLAGLARAEGDGARMLAAARAAHAAASRPELRFAAARLAALANAGMGQDTRAQIWLRRARPDAQTEEEVADLARDYRQLRARNPLSFNLDFGITPASNINGGSNADTVILPGLPFEFLLSGDARALSGLQISAGVDLSYRLQASETASTTLRAELGGRTYALSRDAQEAAPDARGSDYADVTLSAGITHRRAIAGWSGPLTFSLGGGQSWYDGDPFTRFLQGSVERSWRLGERARISGSIFGEWQDRLRDDEGYGTIGLRTRWTQALEAGRLDLSLSLRDARTDLEDLGYDGATFGGDFTLAEPVGPVTFGFGASLDLRRYDQTAYATGTREDQRGTLRVTLGLPQLDLYGFTPTLTAEIAETWSNVDFFEKSDARIDFGFRSSF